MQNILQSLFVLLFLAISAFAQLPLHRQSINNLKKSLDESFYPGLSEAISSNEEMVFLLNMSVDVERKFLTTGNGKVITSAVYDQICKYFLDMLTVNGLMDLHVAQYLTFILKRITTDNINVDNWIAKKINKNKVLLGVMADVCHLFKAPVQWLVLTSKAYGYSKVFERVPVLLENLRKAFLTEIDPLEITTDFSILLDIIKNSFSFYFGSIEDGVKNSAICHLLTTQFFAQLDEISAELKDSPTPFREYFTNKRNDEIVITDELASSTTNEDLWAYIIDKIGSIRPEIDENTHSLKSVSNKNIIDIINQNLLSLSQNSVPFTLKAAHKSIKRNFRDYSESICDLLDTHGEIDIANEVMDDIVKVKAILVKSLKKFSSELSKVIDQLLDVLDLGDSIAIDIDWTSVSIGKLAFGHFESKN